MCLGLDINPRFYPRLCKFLLYVINSMCACVRTSAEDGNFPREGRGCVYPMILFYLRVLCFSLSEKILFEVLLGLLGITLDQRFSVRRLRDRGCMTKSV